MKIVRFTAISREEIAQIAQIKVKMNEDFIGIKKRKCKLGLTLDTLSRKWRKLFTYFTVCKRLIYEIYTRFTYFKYGVNFIPLLLR